MKITEATLRKMIREVIKEASTSSTAAGAKKKGYQSSERKAAQTDYDAKSDDYVVKTRDYDAAVAAKDDSKRYRKAVGKKGYTYSGKPIKGGETNPDWTKQGTDVVTTGAEKSTASTAKSSASTTLDTEKAADLEKTVPKQKPPAGIPGKGKGKKGKKKNFNNK